MNAEWLTRTLEEFLGEASGAVVIEDGAVMFDLAESKYSISGEHNKCLLHLWSRERNTVRRVLGAGSVRGQAETGAREKFSWIRDLTPDHPRRSGGVLRPDLRAACCGKGRQPLPCWA
jgi:hypothetical protein